MNRIFTLAFFTAFSAFNAFSQQLLPLPQHVKTERGSTEYTPMEVKLDARMAEAVRRGDYSPSDEAYT